MKPLDDETLILTTEDLHGFGERVFLLLFLNGFSAIITIAIPFAPRPLDFEGLILLIVLVVCFLAISLIPYLILPRGTWEIDDRGVRFQPLHQAAREISWSTISRIQWGRQTILEAKGVKITLYWDYFPRNIAALARKRVESQLAREFDLSPPRQPEGTVEPSLSWAFLRRIVSLSSIPVLLTGLIFAVAAYVTYSFPGRFAAIFLPAWFGTFLVSLLILMARWAFREQRALRRQRPDWPWIRKKSFRDDLLDP